MTRVTRAWPLIALVALTSSASAQPEDPLAAVDDIDPIELRRAVDRVGDDAVLRRVDAGELLGILATPHMAEPELALPTLVELARGRDPWLAPAAMGAILDIAERPLIEEMERREREPTSLAPALSGLAALAADESARHDMRAAAALARAQLGP